MIKIKRLICVQGSPDATENHRKKSEATAHRYGMACYLLKFAQEPVGLPGCQAVCKYI